MADKCIRLVFKAFIQLLMQMNPSGDLISTVADSKVDASRNNFIDCTPAERVADLWKKQTRKESDVVIMSFVYYHVRPFKYKIPQRTITESCSTPTSRIHILRVFTEGFEKFTFGSYQKCVYFYTNLPESTVIQEKYNTVSYGQGVSVLV